MAAKGEGSNESKKRKRFSATDGRGEKSNPKKVKLPSKDHNKGAKKTFKPANNLSKPSRRSGSQRPISERKRSPKRRVNVVYKQRFDASFNICKFLQVYT